MKCNKISILQQTFENACKIWAVEAGYLWFNSFYFATVNLTFDTASLCFFEINLSTDTSTIFVFDENYNFSNSLSKA